MHRQIEKKDSTGVKALFFNIRSFNLFSAYLNMVLIQSNRKHNLIRYRIYPGVSHITFSPCKTFFLSSAAASISIQCVASTRVISLPCSWIFWSIVLLGVNSFIDTHTFLIDNNYHYQYNSLYSVLQFF